MKRTAWLLFCLITGFGGLPAQDLGAGQDGCASCHRTSHGALVGACAGDLHHSRGMSCADCHGGDAGAKDRERAHARTGTDRPFLGNLIGQSVKACGRCHEEQANALSSGAHARPANASPLDRIADCSSCHSPHGTMAPDASIISESRCAGCHPQGGGMIAHLSGRLGEGEAAIKVIRSRATRLRNDEGHEMERFDLLLGSAEDERVALMRAVHRMDQDAIAKHSARLEEIGDASAELSLYLETRKRNFEAELARPRISLRHHLTAWLGAMASAIVIVAFVLVRRRRA